MKDMNLPMQKGFLLGRKKDIKVVNRICSERQGINRKEKQVEATNKAALNNEIKVIPQGGLRPLILTEVKRKIDIGKDCKTIGFHLFEGNRGN